jgi:DNA-binding transcriptional LysR family regulator
LIRYHQSPAIANILARFLVHHPRVRIALDATNRRVHVVDEGLDIAIRVRKLLSVLFAV